MDKFGNEGLQCSLCDELALPGTNPPMCQEHLDKELLNKLAGVQAPTQRGQEQERGQVPTTLKGLMDAEG